MRRNFALVILHGTGHVLVIPRRCVPELRLLSGDEAADLWETVRKVPLLLSRVFAACLHHAFAVGGANAHGVVAAVQRCM